MNQKKLESLLRIKEADLPAVSSGIPHGDMPGDQISIGQTHIEKAKTIFPLLLTQIHQRVCADQEKIVICVCGGSGVGKSEIASILAFWLNHYGIGTYVLSGDNYPRRFPMLNDAERLRCFREAGVRGMLQTGSCGAKEFAELETLQSRFDDANPENLSQYPWFGHYLQHGRKGLESYLGQSVEIHFDEVSGILEAFHRGFPNIWLRRLGRTDTALWYDNTDFSGTDILILEWTHGNSDLLQGVDIPILLNSTPQETLAHRRARNRDGKTDSAFTALVLQIEQELLYAQAHKAKIILAKSGDVLSFAQLKAVMEEQRDG